MKTKHYNQRVFTFMINGAPVSFYCSTTKTKNGFCHHVYTWGLNAEGVHTRLSYSNRTWEQFYYETALYRAIEKLPGACRAALFLEIENINRLEREKTAAFLKAFKTNFAALSNEQKEFVKKHTPHIETNEQARLVDAGVAYMSMM